MTLEFRKINLIKLILGLDNELIFSKIENVLNQDEDGDLGLMNLMKPMRENLAIEELIREQNYMNPTEEELEKIISEVKIEEPIEELLKMI